MPERTRGVWQRRLAPLGAIVGLAIVAGGGSSATAAESFKVERFVVADRRKDQLAPRVSGDWVIWKDYRALSLRSVDDSPNGQIFAYNLSTNEEIEVSRSKDAGQAAIAGSLVVWTEGSGRTTEIHGQDLTQGKVFAVTTSDGRQEHPAISGSLIVWQDNRNGNWDIYARDLSEDGDFALVLQTADQDRPALSGRTVVWQDWRDHGAGPDIMGLDLDSRETFRVTSNHDGFAPAISGRWVVWVGAIDQAVFAKDLETGRQLRLTSAPGPKSQPAVAGTLVVWTDERNGSRDIYGYDLSSGTEFVVARAEGDQDGPHLDAATIVWSDGRGPNRDISASYLAVPGRTQPAAEPRAAVSAPAAAAPVAPVEQLRVVGTDGVGVNLRAAPSVNAARIESIPEGTVLLATGETRQADGLTWRSVRDGLGRQGWVVAEFVAPL